MRNIKQVLMDRDGMSENDADNLIDEAIEQLNCYLSDGDISSAEDICAEYFGLEPDYLFELM